MTLNCKEICYDIICKSKNNDICKSKTFISQNKQKPTSIVKPPIKTYVKNIIENKIENKIFIDIKIENEFQNKIKN